jgi:citrate/tricarballylate utilization protein
MHATDALTEADRLMVVCNSCRYCEGLCAVFPAMEMRRVFPDGDLNYFANLCHGCGACYDDCQFSPPHEFDVNVPKTLAEVRADSYKAYAWPQALSGLFDRNGLVIAIAAAAGVAVFMIGFVALNDPTAVFDTRAGAGSFYALMPHRAMVVIFGIAFVYAIVALAIGAFNFWRDIGEPFATLAEPRSLRQAIRDACELRYLDGGGAGCMNDADSRVDHRRFYHHLTFYGFLLCFAATCVATLYHYLLGREAPYPWYDLPVVLGTIGGVGLVIGPAGLLLAKWRRDPALADGARLGMDTAFIAMLFLSGFTGLALLALRDNAAMGAVLAVHLGVVFALFVTMPYGKFVHGIYRFLALVRYAKERNAVAGGHGGVE